MKYVSYDRFYQTIRTKHFVDNTNTGDYISIDMNISVCDIVQVLADFVKAHKHDNDDNISKVLESINELSTYLYYD